MVAVVALMVGLAAQAPPTTIPEMWDAWCARCHAPDGSGKVVEPTITVEPMDFTECRVASPEPDADWEAAIISGGPAVGLSSEMPAFGDVLTAEQVRGFIRYIRGFCRERGWPSGNMNFPRPLFTEKAFPENELVILPMVSHTRPEVSVQGGPQVPERPSLVDVGVRGVYERRFGRRAMWEATLPLTSLDGVGAGRQQGLGDIELGVKYVLHASDGERRPRIVSAGFETAFPTGSRARGLGRGTTVFEPYLAAGTMLGDVYLQAEARAELAADRASAGRAVIYNVYAGRDTSMLPDTWTLGVELNGENHEVAVTPQVRKGLTRTGALAAAAGVRIPMTARREQGTRLVGYLLWEYLEPVRAR